MSKILITLCLVSVLLTGCEYKMKNQEIVGLCDKIDQLYNDNAYIKVQTGEESYNYLRLNKKGEGYASNGLVELPTNEIVSLNLDDDRVYRTNEGLYITEILCALELADKDLALFDTQKEEDSNRVLYTVTIEGEDNIMQYYNLLTDNDNSFANISYQVLLQSVDEEGIFIEINVGVDTENTNNNGFSARYSFGDADTEYTSWIIDGYITTPDWELDKDWYNKSLSADRFRELLDELDKETNLDLVLSNNDLFDEFETDISYEEYETSDTKNEIINKVQKELASVGIISTMDTVSLKRAIVNFYDDEVYKDVPLIKAAAYICSLNGQALESEPEEATQAEIPEDIVEQIADSLIEGATYEQ